VDRLAASGMAYGDSQDQYGTDGVHVLPYTPASIAALRADWEDLAANAIEPNVFLEPWVAEAALELVSPDRAEIVAFFDEGRLIAIAVMTAGHRYAHLPLEHSRSHVHPHQFLATPLVREGCEQRFAALTGIWLDTGPDSINFCRLTHMAESGAVHKAVQEHCAMDGRRCEIVHRTARPAIDATLDLAAYLDNHVSRRRKKRLRRLARRLDEQGIVQYEKLTAEGRVSEWLSDFLALEQGSWKGSARTAIQCNGAETAFFHALIPEAHRRGQLVFNRLTVDGKAIAYALDLRSGKTVFSLKVAFDTEFARFSPGMQLEFHCLQQYLADPETAFVDSCATGGSTSLCGLWGQSISITQTVIARKGLRYGLPLTAARILEQASAASTRIIRHRESRP